MTITLSPETEARLRAQAEQLGQDAESLAEALLADSLTDDTISPEEMSAIDAGIARGDAEFAAGHFKSLADIIKAKQVQFGLIV